MVLDSRLFTRFVVVGYLYSFKMEDDDEEVWPLEDSLMQLQFVIVMVNGLMSKMMELHSGLCGQCKEKSDPDKELVRISSLMQYM